MICKKCHSEIDEKAAICVHCGAKTKNYNKAIGKKPFYGKWWFWLIVVLLVFFLIGSLPGEDVPEETTPPTSVQTEPITEATTEATLAATEPPTTIPEITVYESGMYKVGSEIDPGEYFVTRNKGSLAYVQVDSDSTGSFDSIVATENIATFHYISVIDGQYLTVKRGTFVKAEDAEVPGPDSDGNYGVGMYRVGIDIPAGEYKATPRPGDSIYYEVTSDSTGDFLSIVANGHSSDSAYITVEEGQYFKLKGGTFTLVE